MTDPVVARLNRLWPGGWTAAQTREWCKENAAGILDSTNRKGRPATHFACEIQPHVALCPDTPDSIGEWIRWSEIAFILRDMTGLTPIARTRGDTTTSPDKVPLDLLHHHDKAHWISHCNRVGYNGVQYWGHKDKLGPKLAKVLPLDRVAVPYASQHDYSQDEQGLKTVHATSVLLNAPKTIGPIVDRLCDFADTIETDCISVANKWQDWCTDEAGGYVPIRWGSGSGLYPLGPPCSPGSAITAYEQAVAVAATRGKTVVTQRYDPDGWGLWSWPDVTKAATVDWTACRGNPGS